MIETKVKQKIGEVFLDLESTLFKTLGPNGKNILLCKDEVKFTKDGISILNAISYPDDNAKQAILDIIRDSSFSTFKHAGDGTTSTAVLAAAIYDELVAKGFSNIQDVKEYQTTNVLSALEYVKTKVTKDVDLTTVAYTAANNNTALADLAVQAVQERGTYGTITLTKAPHLIESRLTKREGYIFERGYLNSNLVNSLEDQAYKSKRQGYVLVVDGKIESFTPLVDMYTRCKNLSLDFYVVAREFTPQVLATFIENFKRNQHVSAIVPVLIAGFMDEGTKYLEDLAMYLDTEVVPSAMLKEFTGNLGLATYVEITNSDTIIQNDEADLEAIQAKVEFLKKSMINRSPLIENQIKTRLKQLNGVNIFVEAGGVTAAQVEENFDILDDAIKSTENAYDYGLVPGAGRMYIDNPTTPQSVAEYFKKILEQGVPGLYETLLTNPAMDSYKTVEEVYINAYNTAVALYNLKAIIY